MFGLGRSLRKVGVRAYAEVISAEQTPISVTIGNPNLMGNTEIRWRLQLRVHRQDVVARTPSDAVLSPGRFGSTKTNGGLLIPHPLSNDHPGQT